MHKLSIVTINYNNSKGLQRTIESVVSQKFSDFEYIIIDGGSTDDSVEIIKKYADKINYWVSEKDQGVFFAQNKGLEKASGVYVQVLNSGDELSSNTILSEVFQKEYSQDILYGNMIIKDGNGKVKQGYMPSKITLRHMIKDTIWHPVSFVRNEFLKKVGYYNTDYKLTADYEWFLRALFIHNARTRYLNKFIAVFYEDGLSSDPANTKKIISEKEQAQSLILGSKGKLLKKILNFSSRVINKAKVFINDLIKDKTKPVTDTYSAFGIPGDFFITTDKRVKVIIDPPPRYFNWQYKRDIKNYDKTLLIQGCETPDLNNIRKQIIRKGNQFTKVLSFDPEVLKAVKDSELFCFGSSWVTERFKRDHKAVFNTNKKFKVSFIRSSKNDLPGHKLRHEIEPLITLKYDFELFFPKSRIESKAPLFEDSMFHITIENSRHENYFTEKLIDCFMSYTIPLYWGCPNIADYFDPNGIIVVNNKEELQNILSNLKPEDYTLRLEAVKKNFLIAKDKYAFFFDRVNEYILSL